MILKLCVFRFSINSISYMFGIRPKISNKLLRKIDVFPRYEDTQTKH